MTLWKGMGIYADKLRMWRCGVDKSLPLALAENNNLLEVRGKSMDLFMAMMLNHPPSTKLIVAFRSGLLKERLQGSAC